MCIRRICINSLVEESLDDVESAVTKLHISEEVIFRKQFYY